MIAYQERRFTDLLETKLNQQMNQMYYEVINAGVNGYGTDLELILFVHEGFKYKPDLIILSFYVGNDVMDNSRDLARKEKPFFVDQPYFLFEDGTLSLKNYPIGASVLVRSSTYRLISNITGKYTPRVVRLMNQYGLLNNFPLYGEYIENGIPLHIRLYSKYYEQEWLKAWDITKALITKLQGETIKHDARFLVLIVPDKLQFGYGPYWEWTYQHFPAVRHAALDMNKPTNILRSWLAENEIPFLDLLPVFQEYGRTRGRSAYFEIDIHLNEDGHQLVAETLSEFLSKNGYIPR